MQASESYPADLLYEPLTRREAEILALLAEGLTGPEIAERLTIAISSVKTHIQHLYGKLGANSKRQAVERARSLGLLRSESPLSPSFVVPEAHLRRPLPTGTVTFFFTDIEGSTSLWELTAQAMKTAVARHHSLLRQAIESNYGYVFKIIGDSFQASFALAQQALSAALTAQHLLQSETWEKTGPLRVRIGLHTGPAELENDDYAVSHILNRAARIMSAGHGGQILLSRETSDLVERDLPPGVALKHLGEYHLKGLLVPEQIIQVVAPDLPSEFPPLVSLAHPKHNLPRQFTRFYGREKEISQVKALLAEHALVTLTGSGGVGKTRLSLQLAEEVVGDFADSVWMIELAALSDPALVPQQVAITLGVREAPGQPILDYLVAFLRTRQTLLVLDNCEHLLDACARLADALLRKCPSLKILASSREPLGVAGEALFRVPSLPYPDPENTPDVQRLDDYTAIHLFVDRARLVLPGYQVTQQNAPSMARICQRLDGIPLALELAAARAGILTTEQLADRLNDAFRLLTGGSRTALPRQQTLRATIDWSYNLLCEKERLLFQRLSVFAGGCTLEAAEAVCAGEGLEKEDVLDLLASLVSKSMIIVDRQLGKGTRYHLLETVRQYAGEKLRDAREGARLRTRHRDYFYTFAETNIPKTYTRERFFWIKIFDADYENLRLALDWCFHDQSNIEAGPRLVLTMTLYWEFHKHLEGDLWYRRGISWCQSHPGLSPGLHARFLSGSSHAVAWNDPQTALILAKQGVEISHSLGPEGKETLIMSLLDLVWTTMWDLDDVEQALAPFTEAEGLFHELEPEEYGWLKSWLFAWKAEIANKISHFEDAKMFAKESIRINKHRGDHLFCIWPLIFLGEAHLNLEEYDQARTQYLEAKGLAEELHDDRKALALRCLAMVDFRLGNLNQALEYSQEALKFTYEIPDYNIIATCLGLIACILGAQGIHAGAARLSGAAKTLYEKQGRKPMEDSSLDTILPGWQEWPEREAIFKAHEGGRAMTVDQAVAFGLNRKIT